MSGGPSTVEEAVEIYLERRRLGRAPEIGIFCAQHSQLGLELRHALEGLALLDSTPADASAPPDSIGAYRILGEIGRGGMGVVYEAREEPLGRRVALKVLPAELVAVPTARARFRREAELAARLDHSGICTVYGAGVDHEQPWIAMRFLDGETLARLITRSRENGARCVDFAGSASRSGFDSRSGAGSISGSRVRGREAVIAVAACLARVARALQAAHEQGVLHRDVKPSNVIVATDGTPVLFDFGLALTHESDGLSLTRTGETAGTPAYLAPELIAAEVARPDAQTDVYSLGVTLYECLALRRPFDGPTQASLYRSILSGAAEDLSRANPDVPRDLAVVASVAMERERARRYQSAAALAEDLEAVVAGRPVAARPISTVGRIARWSRREPRQALLAASLVTALVALGLFGGRLWASRDDLRNAALVAREQELESALLRGFTTVSAYRSQDADAHFEGALALDPHNVEATAGLVLSSFWRNVFPEARERLALVPDARVRAVLAALLDGKPSGADEASAWNEASAIEWFLRGVCWQIDTNRRASSEQMESGRRAFECFTQAVVRAPQARALYHQFRAQAAQAVGDEKAARSSVSVLTQMWPNSERGLYAAGRALSTIDPRAARLILERALAVDPRARDTLIVLAFTSAHAGDVEAIERYARRGLSLYPDDAMLTYWLGHAAYRQECRGEGHAAYVRATELDPKLTAAWYDLALADFIDGNDTDAIRAYERALALDPQNHRVRLNYGAVLGRQGDGAAARRELDHAIAGMYPSDASFWPAVTDAFLQLRAFDAAIATSEAGLALVPGDSRLEELQSRALAELGR